VIEQQQQDWDPRSASVLEDQRAAYDEMRERCPVAYSDFLGWSLFRHEDVVNVVDDPTTFSSASPHRAIPNGMDPPEHTTYRQAFERFFAPDRMATFDASCRRIAEETVRDLLAADNNEFVRDFAHPFALKSLCAFLGWPEGTWEQLHGWTHGNQEASLSRSREDGARLASEFAGYVMSEVRRRRDAGAAAPDDITTSLMRIKVEGRLLSDEEIVSILRNWAAGHGTVASGIEILVWHLARDEALQDQLRLGPSLIAAAVEEILRVDGPLVANRRTATRAVAINDREIPAGAKLTLMWIAADRDSGAFDEPYLIRLDRDQAGNLLFGAGIHFCLGAPLARLEMRIAIEALLSHTSSIRPAVDATARRSVYPSNGFESLPLRFLALAKAGLPHLGSPSRH
jgi:cytochrome P450